ncbi:ABC transporter permease [Streptomyces sp. NPDC057654]|uniref:ABC transporter permease n=1 Tax=Streptomyces sp. NPDC057654 TaxID=3346196 RepID=UPI00367D066C
MSRLDDATAGRDGARRPPGKPPGGLAAWARDLMLGVRFAAGGGRQGWIRTTLTAVGVGLGVALLLGASSIPNLLDARNQRGENRYISFPEGELHPSDHSFRYLTNRSAFRDDEINGILLQPDGARPPAPPGVAKMPGPGEMVVSPALRDLLHEPGSGLLRERLKNYKVVGTIGDQGVVGPSELIYYAGSDNIGSNVRGIRTDHFGGEKGYGDTRPMDAELVLVIIVACVVLLMPVAVFIATAVRFGGEQRDRRLAALRLVGADRRMTGRIAAGEALFGALLGLVLGTAFFLLGRELIGSVTIWDINVFPADVTPVPWLAAIVVLAIPASAVAVTLFALRGISIEPLGVVRGTGERRRRLLWRLAILVLGLALLLPLAGSIGGSGSQVKTAQVATGAALMLLALTLLLPWLVEAAVGRFKGGPVAWQLATRRLQLSSGTAARAVSGITVAVAGTIALQMLFSGVQGDFRKATGMDSERAQLYADTNTDDPATAHKVLDDFRNTKGVAGVIGTIEATVERAGPLRKGEEFKPSETLMVGDCPTLKQIARMTGGCKDGDVFLLPGGGGYDPSGELAKPGTKLDLRPPEEGKKSSGKTWTVPKSARTLQPRTDPRGDRQSGIYATPSALRASDLQGPALRMTIRVDPRQPDAADYVRNTAARIDPTMFVRSIENFRNDKRFNSVTTGLYLAAGATMLLIAASMLVSMLEQLRERRRLLSVLVAFGTRRTTMAWSVLWQTAVPVVLGLALAIVGGLGLGVVLMRMLNRSTADWLVFVPMTGVGAAVILVVTLISLPPLWRMMRPDGLRTE